MMKWILLVVAMVISFIFKLLVEPPFYSISVIYASHVELSKV